MEDPLIFEIFKENEEASLNKETILTDEIILEHQSSARDENDPICEYVMSIKFTENVHESSEKINEFIRKNK